MELPVLQVTVLTILLSTAWADCPFGCICKPDQSTIICEGLTDFPTPDAGYTDFIFDNCYFPGELKKLPSPYNGAKLLQLTGCGIEGISLNAFEDMKELKTLALRGNKIEFIDASALHGLENLLSIDLQANRITTLEDDIFKSTPMIQTVNFNDNPIETIQKRAFAQPQDPSKDPEKMSKIEYISLENCKLVTIPSHALCMHSKVPHLKILDLSRNNFSALEEFLFEHTDGLEELQLDRCQMKSIGTETLGALTKLKRLWLSNNMISTIDKHAFDDFYATMEEVHLDYNKLEHAPYGLFNMDTLKVLNVSHNPWECSCTNGWIQDIDVQANNTNYNVTCASPEKHVGKHALQVMNHDVEKCEAPSEGPDPMIAVYVAIPIIVILSVITIIIIVKICVLKKKESRSRSQQYSLVYKPTTEQA